MTCNAAAGAIESVTPKADCAPLAQPTPHRPIANPFLLCCLWAESASLCNMPPACVYSAGDGNGKVGRRAAYLPDHSLRDGVGGRNGNSRLLAAQFSAPNKNTDLRRVIRSVELISSNQLHLQRLFIFNAFVSPATLPNTPPTQAR